MRPGKGWCQANPEQETLPVTLFTDFDMTHIPSSGAWPDIVGVEGFDPLRVEAHWGALPEKFGKHIFQWYQIQSQFP